jgi:hypothetical protein
MVIVRDSGELHDPNKHEAIRLKSNDRQTVSLFTRELTSPLRPEAHPAEDDSHIVEVELPAALHELGEQPNMQAVRLIELVAAGALHNLEDAKRLFDAATAAMDDEQKAVLDEVWSSTVDARARLPHAQSDIEVQSTHVGLSRLVDAHAIQHPADKRLGTYLSAFGAGLTRDSEFGAMHADQLDAMMETR